MIKLEFKEPEKGLMLRSIWCGISSIFAAPIITYLMIFFVALSYIQPYFILIHYSLIIFTLNYLHFSKNKDSNNTFSFYHYFSTIFNTIKYHKEIQIQILIMIITLIISGFHLVFNSNENSTISVETSFIIHFIIFFFVFLFISISFLHILIQGLLYNLFYYFLMKSNEIFNNFSNLEKELSARSIENLKNIFKLKNVTIFYTSAITIFSALLFIGGGGFILNSIGLNSPPLEYLSYILFSTFQAGFFFNIIMEIMDGKKESNKIKAFKESTETY